jgi:hypothetical protein
VAVEEALRVGTINGDYASFEENRKGSITAGKLADLVVLGRDPLRVDRMSLIDIPIERTMTGGRWCTRRSGNICWANREGADVHAALRATIDEGKASSVAKRNVFARIRKTLNLPATSRQRPLPRGRGSVRS